MDRFLISLLILNSCSVLKNSFLSLNETRIISQPNLVCQLQNKIGKMEVGLGRPLPLGWKNSQNFPVSDKNHPRFT